jgi:hypothetical protein
MRPAVKWACVGVAVLVAMVVIFAAMALASPYRAQASGPHAVSLSDARTPPTWVAMVRPGRSVRPPVCALTDVQAYTWVGRALAAQRGRTWRARGGWVVWTGRAFLNRSRVPALVGTWCEAAHPHTLRPLNDPKAFSAPLGSQRPHACPMRPEAA